MKKKTATSKRAKRGQAPASSHPILKKVLDEVHQSPSIRQDLIAKIEDKMGNKTVLTFFTSFRQPAGIDNKDTDMIEGILQKLDLKEGLVLIINSAGGDALAAERIVNTCRQYSGGNFEVIVPKMAKSAATMICFGANCIHMSNTAELGPIDPQVSVKEDGEWKSFSVDSIVRSYRRLIKEAVSTKGRIEPYLQQLSLYDPRQIKQLEMVRSSPGLVDTSRR